MFNSSKDAQAWVKAEGQLWLITLAQLIDLGFTREAIRHRLRTRRIWRIYPGVYAVGHPAMTPERSRLAAVLACGGADRAGMSLLSAAVHWEIWEGAAPLRHHVSIAGRAGRAGARLIRLEEEQLLADRIQIHRPRRFDVATDVVTHANVPVTTLLRTQLDLAGVLKRWELRSVFRQAERVHRFDLLLVKVAVDAAPASSWRAVRIRRALGYILDATGTTQTEREALYLDICKRHGLPLPVPQHTFGTRRADMAWPDLGLVAEIDDRSSHDGYVSFVDDRKRDREFANRGQEVIRFTVSECRHEEALVASDTRKAMIRRQRLLGLVPLAA